MKKIKPLPFMPRCFGVFSHFLRYLTDGVYAARCQKLAENEPLAAEVDAKIVYEEVEVIREVTIPALANVSTDGAYQLLQLLQQEARFVDFCQEDIAGYSDADVGAAARQIHSGCYKVMQQYFQLEAIVNAHENSRIEVPAGYNPREYKLEGRIQGNGPFSGTLIHSGWRVTEVKLPQVSNTENLSILAPAEVEV